MLAAMDMDSESKMVHSFATLVLKQVYMRRTP